VVGFGLLPKKKTRKMKKGLNDHKGVGVSLGRENGKKKNCNGGTEMPGASQPKLFPRGVKKRASRAAKKEKKTKSKKKKKKKKKKNKGKMEEKARGKSKNEEKKGSRDSSKTTKKGRKKGV